MRSVLLRVLFPCSPAAALLAATGLAAACLAGNAMAKPAEPAPPYAEEMFRSRYDDPQTALAEARQVLARHSALAPAERFWLLLGVASLHAELEQGSDSQGATAEAGRLLVDDAGGTPRQRLWLEARRIEASAQDSPLPEQQRRIVALQAAATAAGDSLLLCHLTVQRAAVLHSSEANTEAWQATEDAAHCASQINEPRLAVMAMYWKANLAERARDRAAAREQLEAALQQVDRLPARLLRNTVLRSLAGTEASAGRPEAALGHLRSMLAGCRQLGDESSAGVALMDMARIHLEQKQPAAAWTLAAAAVQVLRPPRPVYRWATAQALLVTAGAQLGDHRQAGELAQALAQLRAVDPTALTLRERLSIALATSKAEAALGRPAAAYDALLAYVAMKSEIDTAEHTADLRLLTARQAAAAREAENQALRHRAETTRLELLARAESERAMAALLAAMAVLLFTGAACGWRVWAGRRRLADLAMRDELTGAPNRRAILAYAAQQHALACRVDTPFAVAMLDLDHFKRVNDQHGHATGDAALVAFSASAAAVLRGQDRLGRVGGEEWLLVLPGTRIDELPAVFTRLRDAFAQQRIPGLPQPHGLTFSMGGAAQRSDGEALDALIERADRCLYAAKDAGRNALSVETTLPLHQLRPSVSPRPTANC